MSHINFEPSLAMHKPVCGGVPWAVHHDPAWLRLLVATKRHNGRYYCINSANYVNHPFHPTEFYHDLRLSTFKFWNMYMLRECTRSQKLAQVVGQMWGNVFTGIAITASSTVTTVHLRFWDNDYNTSASAVLGFTYIIAADNVVPHGVFRSRLWRPLGIILRIGTEVEWHHCV